MPELWPYQPETGMTETLEWLTEILQSRTGEQRISLRIVPRQRIEMNHLMEDADFAWARLFAVRNSGLPVTVPAWPDAAEYDGTVLSSDTVIDVDTTIMDLRVGGDVVIWESEYNYSVKEIYSMTSSAITLAAPAGVDLHSPMIVPVRTALMPQGIKFTRGTTVTQVTTEFLVADNIDHTPVSSIFPTYLGFDVMTDRPVLLDTISAHVIRAAEFIDNGFGLVVLETLNNYADHLQTISFYDQRGADLWARREWLHSLRGRQKAFWMPTWASELQPNDDILAADLTFEVRSVGPESYYLDKHLMVQLRDGTFTLREIVGSAVVSAFVDELTIGSAFGVDVLQSEMVMMCFVYLSRLNADVVTINYDVDHASFTIPVMEVPA